MRTKKAQNVVFVTLGPSKYFRLSPILAKTSEIHTESIFRYELISCLGQFSPRRPPKERKRPKEGKTVKLQAAEPTNVYSPS